MICTLTTRKLKPGMEQEFAAAMDGAVSQMPEEIRNRWRHVYICQDVKDEDTILSFGFFDGTLEELREIQATGDRDGMLDAVGHMIDEVLLDGSYQVIAEVQNSATSAGAAAEA